MPSFKVSLLDYGAGNVRSVRNAITTNGYEIEDITDPSQIDQAKVLVFPGVGSYGSAMKVLHEKGYYEPLKKYLANHDRPFLGICLGMQTLFEDYTRGLTRKIAIIVTTILSYGIALGGLVALVQIAL